MPKNILVVDDEEDILELVRYNLTKEGYSVAVCASGEEAIAAAKSNLPDLIVLDLMLPGVDGFEVCKQLRAYPKTAHLPIVMLTAKGEDADIVLGLELGADDYITKPFSPRVLVARIRSILRRNERRQTADTNVIKHNNLVINPARFEVLVENVQVELTATEFAILQFLAGHPGWVFTRNQIIGAVKGKDYPVTDRSVDVQVAGLRKKLGEAGDYIETVRGVGYRFKE
ncbi:MAG: DNA-binding response regulator [Myxococcales bacterium]|nr:MAG: DNA-binding response regulator [Myxococcales bacterium]